MEAAQLWKKTNKSTVARTFKNAFPSFIEFHRCPYIYVTLWNHYFASIPNPGSDNGFVFLDLDAPAEQACFMHVG